MSYSQKPLSKCSSLAKTGLQEKSGPLSHEVKQVTAGRDRSCPLKSKPNIKERFSMAFLFFKKASRAYLQTVLSKYYLEFEILQIHPQLDLEPVYI